jgi:broad specificity phosphatase PhoE
LKGRLFYLVRHGQTDWNAAGRWQGQTDVPLNDAGRMEAAELAARLQTLGIRSVASSDLARALETAEIVSRALGVAVRPGDAAFRERAYGPFEGKTPTECRAMDPIAWERFERDPSQAPPGVEPLWALEERMMAGLSNAARHMATPALIVSHGRSIRVLVSNVTGRAVGPIPNVGVYAVRLEHGRPVEAYALPRP